MLRYDTRVPVDVLATVAIQMENNQVHAFVTNDDKFSHWMHSCEETEDCCHFIVLAPEIVRKRI